MPSVRDFRWMAVGAAIFLAITWVALSRRDSGSVHELASKAGKIDLVTGMRAALAAASEAEKSAVLASTDEDSKTYANQSRAATADAERKRSELARRLGEDGTRAETDLLDQLSKAFGQFREIDEKLLDLAVKNSNLKAYGLAFGPAAQALGQMDDALSRLVEKSQNRPDAATVLRPALEAQSAALRIEALLAPHIAEESDEKMTEIEAAMTKQDEAVRASLGALAARSELGEDADLSTAKSSYERFSELRTEILKLSHENTNVRSTAISLSEKRKVMMLCNESLDSLEEAIWAEPPVGVDYGRFGRPVKVR